MSTSARLVPILNGLRDQPAGGIPEATGCQSTLDVRVIAYFWSMYHSCVSCVEVVRVVLGIASLLEEG